MGSHAVIAVSSSADHVIIIVMIASYVSGRTIVVLMAACQGPPGLVDNGSRRRSDGSRGRCDSRHLRLLHGNLLMSTSWFLDGCLLLAALADIQVSNVQFALLHCNEETVEVTISRTCPTNAFCICLNVVWI
jgi:hypothetical protein